MKEVEWNFYSMLEGGQTDLNDKLIWIFWAHWKYVRIEETIVADEKR